MKLVKLVLSLPIFPLTDLCPCVLITFKKLCCDLWFYVVYKMLGHRCAGVLGLLKKSPSVCVCLPDRDRVCGVPGQRTPFQRAMSVDSKPPVGIGGTGRRSAPCPGLIKQESADSALSMGESPCWTLMSPAAVCLHLLYNEAEGENA